MTAGWRWPMAATLLAATGCFGTLQPVSATCRGVPNPVLLGPVDRVGGASAGSGRRVGEFQGEASSVFARSEYSSTPGYTITETVSRRDESQVGLEARKALSVVGLTGDIRLTTLRTWARGWPTGTKNTVYLEGDVVDGGEGR